MKKPQLQREVALDAALEHTRTIYFYSTQDAIDDFKEFGLVKPREGIANAYRLLVDARFNFGEVAAYIANYSKKA